MISLVMVLWLLHRVRKVQAQTVENANDDFPVAPFMAWAMGCAILFHANLDQRPLFDTLWMFALFVGALAMLPQFWLTINNSGNVPAGLNHFIAALTVSCLLRGTFFWYALEDFTSKSWFTHLIKFNLTGYAALTAHVAQVLILGGFGGFLLDRLARQDEDPQQGPFLQQEV